MFVNGAEFGECENQHSEKACKIRIFKIGSSLVQTARLQKAFQ